MNEIEPRFEFRAWARNFGMVETRMRRFPKDHGRAIRQVCARFVELCRELDLLVDLPKFVDTTGRPQTST